MRLIVKRYNLNSKLKICYLVFLCLIFFYSCHEEKLKLTPVSFAQFKEFVKQTGYITDAEKYGWSVVQLNVYDYIIVNNANWRKPDGKTIITSKKLPVTQVSCNDALAYCEWAKKRLPTYNEYWEMVKTDKRPIVYNNTLPISNINDVNILGNVWDITKQTKSEKRDSIRLAGGSLFCSVNTCHGTSKERILFVDKETANINIGFSVINQEENIN